MKLLSITTDPDAGGSSKSLIRLLAGLKILGVNITVVVPKIGYLTQQLDKIQINYEINKYISPNVWPRFETSIDKIKFVPRLAQNFRYNVLAKNKFKNIVKRVSPDIIHSNVSLCTIGYEVARQFRIKHVWHIREYGYLDFKLHSFPSDKVKRNRFLDSYTISITNGIKDYYNLGDKCAVIYNGIKSINESKYIGNKCDYFLFVGHVNEYKGVSDLINAFVQYRKKGGILNLKLIGRYTEVYHKALLSELKHFHLEKYVEFLGQRDDVDDYMCVAKAIIVPSLYEAFGRVTAEAMFNGCLVIGRNSGGTKEQFDLGVKMTGNPVGLRFNDINGLVQQMLNVEKMDNDDYLQMIFSSQRLAEEKFSIEQNVQNSYLFLQRILTSNK